jgi:hypothetical protein
MWRQTFRTTLAMGVLSLGCATGCHVKFSFLDGYSFDYQGKTAERTVEDKIEATIQQIEIDHRFGDVVVEATDGPCSWKWDLKCWATDQAVAEAYLDIIYLQVQAVEEHHSWKLVLPEEADDLRGVQSKLTLLVPPSADVKLANRHGGASVSGVDGVVNLDNRHGSIDLADLGGRCEATGSHGNLAAKRIASAWLSNEHGSIDVEGGGALEVRAAHGTTRISDIAGRAEVESRHGAIQAENLQAGGRLETSHASIRVNDATGDLQLANQHGEIVVNGAAGAIVADASHSRIKLEVASASIECRARHSRIELALTNSDLSSVNASTSHSQIDLTLPAEAKVAIDAHADHGGVESDFSIAGAATGAPVHLRTSHGSIKIRKADD